MQKGKINKIWLAPFIITATYWVSGILWIYLSDNLTNYLGLNPVVQTWKGMFYVSITALLLYFFIYKQIRRKSIKAQLLDDQNQLLKILIESNEKLQVIVFDKKGNIVLIHGTENILGLTDNNLILNKNLSELENKLEWYDDLKRIITLGWNQKKHRSILHIGKVWYDIQAEVTMVGNAKEPLLVLLANNQSEMNDLLEVSRNNREEILRLTNELNEAENSLNNLQAKYNNVFNHLNSGITIHQITTDGTRGKLLEYNTTAADFFGISRINADEIDMWGLLIFDNEQIQTSFNQHNYLTDKEGQYNAKIFNGDKLRNIQLNSKLISINNQPHLLSISRDTTVEDEICHANAALLEESKLVFEKLDDAILLINSNKQVKYYNTKFGQLFAINNNDINVDILNILNKYIQNIQLDSIIDNTIRGIESKTSEFKIKREPNKWFTATLSPLSNNETGLFSACLVIKDITELKEQENAFYIQKLEAEESNHLKTIFLSNLSHEVRTPMNGILGFLDLLELEELNEDQERYIGLIRKSSDQLLQILNAMMEISQIETNQVELHQEWFDTNLLTQQFQEHAAKEVNKYGKSNLTINFNMNDLLVPQIYADDNTIFQIFKHLFDNALKFTHEGNIEVGLSLNENDTLRLWIADTGIGINPSIQSAIFLPFTSFNTANSNVYDGIGLGLSIVKGLVKLLNGIIDFESEPNSGSTFYVEIPVKVPISPAASSNELIDEVLSTSAVTSESGTIALKKVMLIEDSFESAQLMKEYLNQYGIEVVYAYDGITAIEKFYSTPDIELVFCDIRLPDIDGFEVLKAIRRIKMNMPVIANTAYVMNDDRRKCLEAGFDDYLTKPIQKGTLYKILKTKYSR